MAKNTTGNPWVCDAVEVITTQHVRVHTFRWVSKTASAGDDLLVVDNNGDTILASVATGANYVEAHDIGARFCGINITAIDSGKLYIYV